MSAIVCSFLAFFILKSFAWHTQETSEILTGLIDKLRGNYLKENMKYNNKDNDASKPLNDSNIIYFKLIPNESYHLNFPPNESSKGVNISSLEDIHRENKIIKHSNMLDNNNTEDDNEIENLKSLLQKFVNPDVQTRKDVRFANHAEAASEENLENISQFDSVLNNNILLDLLLNKITPALRTEKKFEEVLINLLKSQVKDLTGFDFHDIQQLLKEIFEMKSNQMNDGENEAPDNFIPYSRRTANEMLLTEPINNINGVITNPAIIALGEPKTTSKTASNYNGYPLTWCGNCKSLRLAKPFLTPLSIPTLLLSPMKSITLY